MRISPFQKLSYFFVPNETKRPCFAFAKQGHKDTAILPLTWHSQYAKRRGTHHSAHAHHHAANVERLQYLFHECVPPSLAYRYSMHTTVCGRVLSRPIVFPLCTALLVSVCSIAAYYTRTIRLIALCLSRKKQYRRLRGGDE